MESNHYKGIFDMGKNNTSTNQRNVLIKRFFVAICILLVFLSACGNSFSIPDSQNSTCDPSSEPDNSYLASSEPMSSASINPASRLPVKECYGDWTFFDPIPSDTKPQLLCKDEVAIRLALMIRQLLPAGVNGLPFFENEASVDKTAAIKIAFANTPSVDLSGSSYTINEGFRWKKYPDHPITIRLAQLWKEGNSPTDVFYADDVSAALERLFGITDQPHQTVDYYHYFPEEGVYITYGDMIHIWRYPQILSYQETEDGYSCEVILTDERLGTIGDQEVTAENIERLAAEVPHYYFTFRIGENKAVVTGFVEKRE
jgi:hypothetical protein